MKNLFKYLGAFAIAGALGLQTMTVSAEEEVTCPEGTTMHTNYYMFLDVNPVSHYEANLGSLTEGQFYNHYTQADKANNINGSDIPANGQGNVPITNGTKSTTPLNDKIPSWTLKEYWQRYITASEKADPDSLVYTDGDTSYLLHGYWYTCPDGNFKGCTKRTHADNTQGSNLHTYLRNNYNSIESTPLVTNGTSIPNTQITPPSDMKTIADPTMKFNVERNFAQTELLRGVDVGNGTMVIYSPAVYMVKFCKKGAEAKTITYDANTTDTVTNMPENQTFTDECVNVDSKTPVREGFRFVGWSKDVTAGDMAILPGDKYCGDSVVLHAIWERKEATDFTVTYDANGGKNAPATQSGKAGQCVKISSAKPTLNNNNFLGWSTDKNAKEPDGAYKAGADYCGANGSITLYAVWQTQTGISAHLIAFGAVALVAGGALLVAKKKELFRQI